MLLYVIVFPIQNQKGNKEREVIFMKLTILQGLLHSRVYHNNTLSKGFLTSFLDEETDSLRRDIG